MCLETRIFLNELKKSNKKGRYFCPWCGDHELQVTRKENGDEFFHCWNCSKGGKIKEGVLMPRGERTILPSEENWHSGGSYRNTNYKKQNPQKTMTELPTEKIKSVDEYKAIDPNQIKDVTILTEETVKQDSPLIRAALDYLAEQGIPLAAAMELRVGVANHLIEVRKTRERSMQKCIVYVKHWNGRTIGAKYRGMEAKGFACASGEDKPTLPYNVDCLRRKSVDDPPIDMLVITEGEKDALAVHASGFRHVISVPTGCSADPNKVFSAITELIAPRNVKKVVGCFDTDPAGDTLRQSCRLYFGSRLYEAKILDGCKDIADMLKCYGKEGVVEAINNAEKVEVRGFQALGELIEPALAYINGTYDKGFSIGLGALTDGKLHLDNTGGLIVVTGYAGHGKSTFVQNIITSMIFNNGYQVSYLPFEEAKYGKLLKRMIETNVGTVLPQYTQTRDIQPYINYIYPRYHLLNYRQIDPTPENILQMADVYPDVKMLVIDPFYFVDSTKMGNIPETERIKATLVMMRQWAQMHNCWVVVVAHPPKGKKTNGIKYDRLDLYDVAGSASWANAADFLFTVSRTDIVQENGSANYSAVFTEMAMLKVRDQDINKPGSVFYTLEKCGRFIEHESKESAVEHYVRNMGTLPYLEPWYVPRPATTVSCANN